MTEATQAAGVTAERQLLQGMLDDALALPTDEVRIDVRDVERVIAALDAKERERDDEAARGQDYQKDREHWRERALAAEARLAQHEAVWSDPAALQANLLRTGALSRMNALHIAGATDYDDIKARLAQANEALARMTEQRDTASKNVVEQADQLLVWLKRVEQADIALEEIEEATPDGYAYNDLRAIARQARTMLDAPEPTPPAQSAGEALDPAGTGEATKAALETIDMAIECAAGARATIHPTRAKQIAALIRAQASTLAEARAEQKRWEAVAEQAWKAGNDIGASNIKTSFNNIELRAQLKEARRVALEEAARVCDDKRADAKTYDAAHAYSLAALDIRALSTQAKEGE